MNIQDRAMGQDMKLGPPQEQAVDSLGGERKVYGSPSEWTLLYPVFSSHVKRIGWVRTLAGGLSMYLCIPLLVILHLTCCVVAYQWLMRPLLGMPKVRWVDYVVIDRHRIRGMGGFDKFNCMFCGYANGLTVMANVEMDHIARWQQQRALPLWGKAVLALLMLVIWPLLLIFELGVQIIYNILVSRPLGMHRVSIAQARQILNRQAYARQLPVFGRLPLLAAKNLCLRFAMALEQIESSWCPLKHLETREGVVYPKHHDKFFGPHELEKMREVLSTVGTVSDRRPKW
ncbi:MAG: hypothetical protein LBV61_04555 [Burkholderiaceae bacterium]|jgi:hypothetical protein|nr:hypothetical protein [Burkholderiaceae bacterium]